MITASIDFRITISTCMSHRLRHLPIAMHGLSKSVRSGQWKRGLGQPGYPAAWCCLKADLISTSNCCPWRCCTMHRAASPPGRLFGGYQVVLDKDGITSKPPPTGLQSHCEEQTQRTSFLYAVNVFWFELFPPGQKFTPARVVACQNPGCLYIKNRLLQMIEWHAQASHHWDYDTWIAGKQMQTWGGTGAMASFVVFPILIERQLACGVRFDAIEYRRLAGETATAQLCLSLSDG